MLLRCGGSLLLLLRLDEFLYGFLCEVLFEAGTHCHQQVLTVSITRMLLIFDHVL